MSNYYKAEDVLNKMTEYISTDYPTEERAREDAELIFTDLPTIEMVHCKECRHCLSEEIEEIIPIYIYCDLWKGETEWDSFCSYGERIDDE